MLTVNTDTHCFGRESRGRRPTQLRYQQLGSALAWGGCISLSSQAQLYFRSDVTREGKGQRGVGGVNLANSEKFQMIRFGVGIRPQSPAP